MNIIYLFIYFASLVVKPEHLMSYWNKYRNQKHIPSCFDTHLLLMKVLETLESQQYLSRYILHPDSFQPILCGFHNFILGYHSCCVSVTSKFSLIYVHFVWPDQSAISNWVRHWREKELHQCHPHQCLPKHQSETLSH